LDVNARRFGAEAGTELPLRRFARSTFWETAMRRLSNEALNLLTLIVGRGWVRDGEIAADRSTEVAELVRRGLVRSFASARGGGGPYHIASGAGLRALDRLTPRAAVEKAARRRRPRAGPERAASD
jgi:hypothetical protein